MNNSQGAVDLALVVFGGNVPELSPSDLPEGASPMSADVDFAPGKVFTRAGRKSVYSFAEESVTVGANFGQNFQDAANETPWDSPDNIAHQTIGTYASVQLNTSIPTVDGLVGFYATNTAGGSLENTAAMPPLTPEGAGDWFVADIEGIISGNTEAFTPDDPDWQGANAFGDWNGLITTDTTPLGMSGGFSGGISVYWSGAAALAKVVGGVPIPVQAPLTGTGSDGTTRTFANPISPGSCLVAFLECGFLTKAGSGFAISDDQNGDWTNIVFNSNASESSGAPLGTLAPAQGIWIMPNPNSGVSTTVTLAASPHTGASYAFVELPIGTFSGMTGDTSEQLQALNFPFAIPTTQDVTGFTVEVSGHQTSLPSDAILTLSLIDPTEDSPEFTFQLPTSNGTVTLGTPTTTWGLALTPALLNNPNFGVQLKATALDGSVVEFFVYKVAITAWLTPNPPSNFNWVKTYEQTDGAITTLALDAAGTLWQEDVINNPGVLNAIFEDIEPDTFAKSVTFDDVEYIAMSNQVNGTDVPRLWNGQWLDRVSQYGPGAPPSVSLTGSGSTIATITQNAPYTLPTGPHNWILVSAAPSDHGTFGTPSTPGNVFTVILARTDVPPVYFVVGSNIVISGFPTINGNDPNSGAGSNPSFYTITSVGQTISSMQSYDWITFQVPFTTFYAQENPGGCEIQATIATLTATQQVPYLEVGNQMTIAGTSVAAWDNTFTVSATPNAAQLQITDTSLTSNVATYAFSLISGVAPVVGQFVTVTGTLNGDGIFNVTNGAVVAATGSSFSLSLIGANVTASAENGSGIVSGTIFQFDPAGTLTNPVPGNSTGGQIVTSGVMGIGIRQCVCIFQTRNGALTAPSPYVQFTITAATSAITVSNIPIGPPNVIARILAFTGAGGANFFYIPIPVTVTSNGQLITYSSTIITDNVTTHATLTFPDAVLLAGTAIDVQGNDLFNQIELGSNLGFLSYGSRLIAWGEQQKIQNLLNLSFDGGIGTLASQIQGSTVTYPLGWTVDTVFGQGGSILTSPIFGNSYYIKNSTGSTQGVYGLLWQNAFQDQFGVPIVLPNTRYSIRVTARCPSGVTSGSLIFDISSPKLNTIFGFAQIPLASMTSEMQIFTVPLLTTPFAIVPNDLEFRVYANHLPDGGDIDIDRGEPFDVTQPVFSTQFHASYENNPEAFDLVTGLLGPDQNQQPIRGGAVLFDSLYALKERSMYSTTDNGVTEPDGWTWREVSNRVGAVSTNSYDYGEGWLITACRAGVYMFTGGEPIKISQEIQPVWDSINWAAAQTIWLRNDETNRRVYIGVPITTPNQYMPEMPAATNPTSPNVVLMCNYRELNTGVAIADTGPIRASYTGRLLAPEPARKWSYWNILSPYGDFIERQDGSFPLFYCTGYENSQIYELDADALDDDGAAINSYWISYGFTKPDTAQSLGLGQHRVLAAYMTLLATGTGSINTQILPDNPASTLGTTPSPIPLSLLTTGDLEIPINRTAQRFFIRVGTNAVGEGFSLSKIVLTMTVDKMSPIRGTAR